MKIIDKTGLTLFSTLMLIISIISLLLIFGVLETSWIFDIIDVILVNTVARNIWLGLNIFFIILAIKCIFFESSSKERTEYKNGILLENSDGKLLITKDTLENLVNGIVKGFDSAENVTTRVELDKENNVRVFVNLSVKENAVIKELSTNLKNKIKNSIKRTSDLEVKEVNIKIKDIEPVKNIVQE